MYYRYDINSLAKILHLVVIYMHVKTLYCIVPQQQMLAIQEPIARMIQYNSNCILYRDWALLHGQNITPKPALQ